MFRQDTTIVVGAGASCEIGLPSGDQLKTQILKLFEPSDDNAYGLKNEFLISIVKARLSALGQDFHFQGPEFQKERSSIRDAAARIFRGLPLALSIDNFLHTHQNDDEVVRLGKTAIAITILSAEQKSAFYERVSPVVLNQMRLQNRARLMTLKSDALTASWYLPFAQLLMSGISRSNAAEAFRRIRFIIFNYDRCLEQFLWMALQAYYDISAEEAAIILSDVDFLHPYGSLGPLPWQTSDHRNAVALGGGEAPNFWQIGSGIRTFTESVESSLEPRIKDAIQRANTILLLGFGYLDQNVQLLTPYADQQAERVITSAYGVSQYDQTVISSVMKSFSKPYSADCMIEPGTCREVFNNFRLRLSLQ